MRRILLLATFLLVMGTLVALPVSGQQLNGATAHAGVMANSGHPYCGGMPFPC